MAQHPVDAKSPVVDLAIRVEFGHAALQHLADLHGVDVLHIKGVAFAPEWRSRGTGSDADILVRPSQVPLLLTAMEAAGWERRSRFHTGSPFGHAQTYWHQHLGYADVHRFFPGFGRDEATFEVLWQERDTVLLAGITCPAPSPVAQALVFALNEARNGPGSANAGRVQDLLSSPTGAQVADLVPRLGAEVGWAVVRGDLASVRNQPEHDLWRAVTQGTGRVDEWRARIRAERTVRGKALVVLRAPLVNIEHLANTRGHQPTTLEVSREFFRRARQALVEVRRRRPRLGRDR